MSLSHVWYSNGHIPPNNEHNFSPSFLSRDVMSPKTRLEQLKNKRLIFICHTRETVLYMQTGRKKKLQIFYLGQQKLKKKNVNISITIAVNRSRAENCREPVRRFKDEILSSAYVCFGTTRTVFISSDCRRSTRVQYTSPWR